MKKTLFVIFLIGIILVSNSAAQKKRKRVRHEKKKELLNPEPVIPEVPLEEQLRILREEIQEVENEIQVEDEDKKIESEPSQEAAKEEEDEQEQDQEPTPDPCAEKRCGPGRECVPGENGKARCKCMELCPEEVDIERRKVCSNYNETWQSDCELYRARCHCKEDMDECVDPHLNKHLHIDYYGECREMPQCSEEEMSDFPRRMRDWLFNIMRELAERRELSQFYMELEREAEQSEEDHRSAVAAIWKWCDLDGHPNDRVVSRHELFPIRAPLMTLEHCIAPFLDNCDADNDHRITLKEWGICLQLPEKEIEEKCDKVKNAQQFNEEGDEEV